MLHLPKDHRQEKEKKQTQEREKEKKFNSTQAVQSKSIDPFWFKKFDY